jgi:predicted CXXCH cytochrome family protein
MKHNRIIYTLLGAAILLLPIALSGQSIGHMDNLLLPEGCGSCHVGHGVSEEPMLTHSEEEFCYQCHGSEAKQSTMKSVGKLAEAANLADIEREFDKPYRHPVVEGFGHSPTEELPSYRSSGASHAECVDCHNPHQRVTGASDQRADVPGLSLSRQYLQQSVYEYQVCLKCHTDAAGFESPEVDMARAFATSVTSQHPVTKASIGERSVSLLSDAALMTQMKCSDCHTNDDPDGPRGPHGSNYPYMLSANYNTDGYATESAYNYAFCYSCHDRESILGNESFPLHSQHIEGDPVKGISGTSCYTCHSSHSSRLYGNLLRFNQEIVSRNSAGQLEYLSTGENSGACYLSCHDVNHQPGDY